jgi:hypothetical protein
MKTQQAGKGLEGAVVISGVAVITCTYELCKWSINRITLIVTVHTYNLHGYTQPYIQNITRNQHQIAAPKQPYTRGTDVTNTFQRRN